MLVLDAGVEVIRAVRRGGVHRAGALVHGDVVGQHAQDCALQKRMRKLRVLQFLPGEARDTSVSVSADSCRDLGGQCSATIYTSPPDSSATYSSSG